MSGVTIVGNNLASLICASELANKGRKVTLLTDNKPLGGHFRGFHLNNRIFDFGMVLIEQATFLKNSKSDAKLDYKVRNSWVGHGQRINNWFINHSDLIRTPTATCQINGQCFPDFMISNRMEAIHNFAGPNKKLILNSHHPKFKNSKGPYDQLSYGAASSLNHGQSIHDEIVEPFINKIFNISSHDFLARFHRVAWAPLYYPETILEAAENKAVGLPEYPFWTTEAGSIGHLVAGLEQEVCWSNTVDVVRAPIKSMSMEGGKKLVQTDDGKIYSAPRMICGLSPQRVSDLLRLDCPKHQDCASVSILMAEVRSDSINNRVSCHMIVDECFASYRLVDQDSLAGLEPEWRRLTLEASPAKLHAKYPDTEIEAAMVRELRQILQVPDNAASFIRTKICVSATNALPIPTGEHVAASDDFALLLAERYPWIDGTATLLGYGKSSFNDQLLQGLHYGDINS